MFNINVLKSYKAKLDNTTIYQHNQQLLDISKKIRTIYDINDRLYLSLIKVCNLHDIGKIHKEFQDDIGSKKRKVRHEILSASYLNLTIEERIAILLHHKDIKTLNKMMLKSDKYYDNFREDIENILDIKTIDIRELLRKLKRSTLCCELKNQELIYLKGYLQLCDHLASAKIKVLDKGLDIYRIYNYKSLSSIQQKVMKLEDKQDIIIQAMTGLGKTSTAMYWSDLIQNKNRSKRIYYILPYIASINAKYKEFDQLGISTAMLHSKAQYFLNKEFSDREESKNKYQLFKKSIKQVTICTIYQLFKAFFSCKNFEMLLCQMKNSIFIIDEIHCFDIKQLALILTTLKYLKNNFGIYICIMSASVPNCLLKLIKQELNIDTIIRANKKDLIIRHKIYYYNNELIDSIDKIRDDLKQGKRVLICVNSVRLSQELYNNFKDKYKVKLIHGKFNMEDRKAAEQDLQLQDLLIGTQTIEISLDISYDVLYTEIAPFDALIQRFGRVNRKGEKGICNIHIFNDNNNTIYDKELIKNTYNILQEIIEKDKRIICENKINYYLNKVYKKIDIEKYNKRKNDIISIINNLRVGIYYKDSDMIEKCGYMVLPKSLLNRYTQYIKRKDYLNAMSLLVNLTDKQFYIAKDNNHIRYIDDLRLQVCDYMYSSIIGMEINFDNN